VLPSGRTCIENTAYSAAKLTIPAGSTAPSATELTGRVPAELTVAKPAERPNTSSSGKQHFDPTIFFFVKVGQIGNLKFSSALR